MVATTAFFFASLVAFASTKLTLVLHEQRDVPQGFTVTGKANPATKLNLRLGLASRDFAGLEKALYDVSITSSKSYGQHLRNRDEVKSHMAPTSETLQAVNDWFASKNIKSKALPGLGDWIGFSTTVKDAESLFGADFVFKHLDIRKEEVRTLSYSIPAELQGHLEVAHPKTTFHNLYKQTPKVSSPSAFKLGPNAPSSLALSCSSSVTPACLQLLHRIPSKPANSTEASIGVTGYIDQYPQKADLKTFLKKYYTDITSTTTFTLQTLDGGSDPQKASSAGIKANLDVLLSAERFMATSVDSTCHNTPSGWRLESRRILSPSATTSRMATSRASSTRSTPSQARSRRRSCSRRRTARTRTP